ncbi:MAG: SLAC1 anion channel family protein [Ignavibacteriae bacterium]|nr:SLAC1 anion channel family protein [Ignavibacteriota bacterium]
MERLKNFPINFFSIILGLTGFTLALQRSETFLHNPIKVSSIILALTILIFLVILIIYFLKTVKFRSEVLKEFNHPIKLSFFPTISISFIMLSVALVKIDFTISKILWIVGTIGQLLLTLKIISIWIQHTHFEILHMNPAWFIPAVGNILVPISGVDFFSSEISWFFFSIGFFFWIILMVIFFNRIIFHHPLPERLLPTLFILIAPPAVGFISYFKISGEINDFSKILYYYALFLTLLLFFQIKMFGKIKFYFSWWAYSFPLSAITIATILMFHQTQFDFFSYLSIALLIILTFVIGIIFYKTVIAIKNKEVCVEE